jgi:hypothetical protein
MGSEDFRSEVIRRRDHIAAGGKSIESGELELLREIRDSLKRLETLMASKS